MAWLEPDGAGGWRKHRGRCAEGSLDERGRSVRELAREWLLWLASVRGAKPSIVRDYEALLREPGQPFKQGVGQSPGRIMSAFGDRPVDQVSTRDVSLFLRELDAAGFTSRKVNKYRQVLHAIFTHACRVDTFNLAGNPLEKTDKRREPPPVALDYYEVDEVEGLARACERGTHRRTTAAGDEERDARRAEDHRDAKAYRVLFYTGIRWGSCSRFAGPTSMAHEVVIAAYLSAWSAASGFWAWTSMVVDHLRQNPARDQRLR